MPLSKGARTIAARSVTAASVASATDASADDPSTLMNRGRERIDARYAPEMPTHAPNSRIARAPYASAHKWRNKPHRRCTLVEVASRRDEKPAAFSVRCGKRVIPSGDAPYSKA